MHSATPADPFAPIAPVCRYIAKCRCGVITSIAGARTAALTKDSTGLYAVAVTADGTPFTLDNGSARVPCRGCGEPRLARRVIGKFSAKHKCNAKCLHSKGFSCECSCGGKNHGAGYSAEGAVSP